MNDNVKNYVVWTNCQINDRQHRFGIEPCASPEVREAYDLMFRVSQATARRFLKGWWEPVVFTDPAETRVDMFKDNWKRIWDLYQQEKCNILYLDSDTMFIRDTEIFGRFQDFRLFNWTDPKSNQQFANYFNAGVRYYSCDMDPLVWKRGADMAANWNLDIWDQEQLIFNEMFWMQDIAEEDRHHPEFNWQGMNMRIADPQMRAAHEQWNNLSLDQAHIVHVHGSRSAIETAQLMTNSCKQMGISY